MFSLKNLSQLLFRHTAKSKFLIAYSGGLDSHVLLHSMAMLHQSNPNLQLQAVHVNHGLNPHANSWAKHCEQICNNLNISCIVKKVQIRPSKKQSLEAVARTKRYQAIAELITTDTCLLTAHTQTDQAETVLLQLLRGAGPKGLAAMPGVGVFSCAEHLRPLLNFTRDELEQYAKHHQLVWIEDDSNTDLNFDRNYIRHAVAPSIEKRWPNASQTIARAAQHCATANELLETLAQQDLHTVVGTIANTLSVTKLIALSSARQQNVLRFWLQQLQLPLPATIKIQKIQQEVLIARKDAKPLVSWPGVEVRRYQDNLYAFPALKPHDIAWKAIWDLKQPLRLPSNLGYLTAEKVMGEGIAIKKIKKLTVGFRQGGERCQPISRVGSHPLKKLLQEWNVLPWQRDRIPLIFSDTQLVAVADYCYSQQFKARANEEGLLVRLVIAN